MSDLRYLGAYRSHPLLRDGDRYRAGCHHFTRDEALAYWCPRYGEAAVAAVLDAEGVDARSHPDARVRRQAVWTDGDAGRDLAWARTDPDFEVRRVAALAMRGK